MEQERAVAGPEAPASIQHDGFVRGASGTGRRHVLADKVQPRGKQRIKLRLGRQLDEDLLALDLYPVLFISG